MPQASSTEPLPLKLNLTPKLSFKCNDRDVVLSIYKRADEPEGSDILKFTTPENEFLVHSAIFLDYILSTKKNSFITEENEYKEILNGTFLDCNHMDDSR